MSGREKLAKGAGNVKLQLIANRKSQARTHLPIANTSYWQLIATARPVKKRWWPRGSRATTV
jgi:hypothetical protein